MRGLGLFLTFLAGAVCADTPIRFEFDRLDGIEGWPAFDVETVNCLFPQAELQERMVPTRFGDDIAQAIQWIADDKALVTFEATDSGARLFAIWSESPAIVGPNGWQIGSTTLDEIQAELGTCIRGFTAASDRVVCSNPRETGLFGSFVFKEIGEDIDAAASGELAPSWGDARLSRMERYQGDAPNVEDACHSTS